MASGTTDTIRNWLVSLGRHRKQVGNVLAVLWILLAIIQGYLVYQHDSWPELGWGVNVALGLVKLGLLVAILWCFTTFSFSTSDEDHGRLTVAFVGSFLGLALLVLSGMRTYQDWKAYIAPGLEAWQGKGGWHVWVCILTAVGGLAILFLTTALIRSDEYSGRYARVIIYGYMAVQSCLMLLGILVFVNVVAYFLYPTPSDWTSGGLYTLNEQSQAILKSLKQPVKIYYLTAARDDDADVDLLLGNCQLVSDKVQTETVLRDRNIKRMEELRNEYKLPLDASGLLVTYETPEGKRDSQFIRRDEMYEFPRPQNERQRPQNEKPLFKGEAVLITAIDYLAEGKSQATVYFTQGNGELDITGAKNSRPERRRCDSGRAATQKSNCDVKGLILSTPIGQAEPTDSVEQASVLRRCDGRCRRRSQRDRSPKRRSKLCKEIYNHSQLQEEKRTTDRPCRSRARPREPGETGRHGFRIASRGEFSVDLIETPRAPGRYGLGNPVNVLVVGNPRSRNPVLAMRALVQDRGLIPIPMANVRVVRRGNAGCGGPMFQAEELLVVPDDEAIWASDNMNDESLELATQLRTGSNEQKKKAAEKLRKLISQTPLPVAVAVTESAEGADPMNPHAPAGESTPRLVVVGNARFVSDEVVASGGKQADYSFAVVSSSLAWLREKPAGIGIPPADRKVYQMSADTHVDRMSWLPVGLMVLGTIGLGVATWVTRRR